jgi:tetratricopeptide (TPR) repeat protein
VEVAVFHVSFAHKNVKIGDGLWLFPKAFPDRFAWIALLAYRRVTLSHDGGWVSRDDIARLPKWSSKPSKHIGDNVARYLTEFERANINLVEWKRRSTGPYRLTEEPAAVSFDVPLEDVAKALCIAPLRPEIQRDDLIRFVPRYVQAELLFQRGGLSASSTGGRLPTAYSILTDLVKDYPANSQLKLIAILGVTRVLFRIGRFGIARETLLEYEETVRQVGDPVLEAQYYLSLAWSYRRAETGAQSNRKVEAILSKARDSASHSGDRSCLGLLAYREAWSLARKKRYDDALAKMGFAVEAALLTQNFTSLQAYCADLGSIAHRIGPRFYAEARRWILTGILLCRWAGIGRDDAHGEMILGKMYSEMGNRKCTAALWLSRAERIAKAAGNAVNLADIHMVRAFWHRQYGSRKDLIKTLGSALIEFRKLREFDSRQKERYMMLEFPSVWLQVLAFAKSLEQEKR